MNGHLNKALEEQIWKKKTGFNLANYNMDENISVSSDFIYYCYYYCYYYYFKKRRLL